MSNGTIGLVFSWSSVWRGCVCNYGLGVATRLRLCCSLALVLVVGVGAWRLGLWLAEIVALRLFLVVCS